MKVVKNAYSHHRELVRTKTIREAAHKEEVPKPVARRAQCGLLGAGAGREGLADNDPDTGRPGHGVSEDEQAGGDNHDSPRGGMLLWALRRPNSGEDK